MRIGLLLLLGLALAPLPARAQAAAAGAPSRVIEAAGTVEFLAAGRTNWLPAHADLALKPGDRLRTGPQSRAALQLSDRSVIRLDERTTLELQPPRATEKRRFGLPAGRIFFFNREKPADVEFTTPLATGAIRGTEFVLSVAAPAVQLALLDGAVDLSGADGSVSLRSGEAAHLEPGRAPVKSVLIQATNTIQWTLHYPAVVVPEEFQFAPGEQTQFHIALEHYRAGDSLAALASLPEPGRNETGDEHVFRAALELAVGRVDRAKSLLQTESGGSAPARAVRELVGTISSGGGRFQTAPTSASEHLARSYQFQSQSRLEEARASARRAAQLAPQSGIAHARLAELEFVFGNRRAALESLAAALRLSPRLASAHVLRGFIQLDEGNTAAALAAFDRARELDAALGSAWLGRGLCLMRERQFAAARESLQAAAALEPQRALHRSYLAKAASELRDAPAAEKEFHLAQQLDPADPTAWLYSALHRWQENRLNDSVRDLEHSAALNDNRGVFRSRLLLDQDRAVRSANLAAIYADAGLADVSRHVAARAVSEDYAGFSGHLFLANSFAELEDPHRFNLRFETPRQSELLVANLLAPPGAGNLSQVLSQYEHVRYFDPRPISVGSLTEYRSAGDWRQAGTLFGTVGGLSYALDTLYESQNGQRVNEDLERKTFSLQLKQRISASDEFYFQAARSDAAGGDLAQYYDPASAKVGFRFDEFQEPTLYAGWHHAWSPGSHTLVLLARLHDRLHFTDPQPNVLFLRQSGGATASVETPPGFDLNFDSEFTLYSAELQHIWQTPKHALVIGGRFQTGDVDTRAVLNRVLTGVVTDQTLDSSLDRGTVYAYGHWQAADALRVIACVSYDRVTFPENSDLPPLTASRTTRELISPKAGLLWTPWTNGLLRASYTRSLGGLYFDNSVRLEPAQVAGFVQSFRSLIPESVGGLMPGAQFETAAVGFDQSFKTGTYFGVELEWLTSTGERTAGVLTNATLLPTPDSPGSTRQHLDYRERNLSAYVAQLIGVNFSASARYRVSEAELQGRFPDITAGTPGLAGLEQNERALLHQLSLTANFHHRCGAFAQWESAWFHQSNEGYAPGRPGDDFWQHNLFIGYRFPRRHAEIRAGILNLTDSDFRLNPLNLHSPLPRERTFTLSLRLIF